MSDPSDPNTIKAKPHKIIRHGFVDAILKDPWRHDTSPDLEILYTDDATRPGQAPTIPPPRANPGFKPGPPPQQISIPRTLQLANPNPKQAGPKTPRLYHGLPWQKQTWETNTSYMVFQTYLVIGPGRTIAQAIIDHYPEARGLDRPLQSVKNGVRMWSAKFEWVKRAEFYDAYNQALAERVHADSIRSMNKVHADKYSRLFNRALDIIEERMDEPEEITIEELRKLADTATKWERMARGVEEKEKKATSVDVTVTNNTVNLNNLSAQEIKALMDIKQKVLGEASLDAADPYTKPVQDLDTIDGEWSEGEEDEEEEGEGEDGKDEGEDEEGNGEEG